MSGPDTTVDLRGLHKVVREWPVAKVVKLPASRKGGRVLNQHLGQIARQATEVSKRIFQALEENDDGVSWNTERRERDAAELLFIALAQTRFLGISEDKLLGLLEGIAKKGGP